MRIKREENTRAWVAIALMAAVAALLGGSSRPDAVQIIALRPLAALFLIPALYFITRERLADIRALLIFAVLLSIWMALQLVPLPPAIWQAFPGREPISAIGDAVGLESIWRPISLVPARTLNALISMVVPVTGLLLAAAFGVRPIALLLVIVGLGVVNAGLSFLQILGVGEGLFYLYEFTNRGAPVGIFANENHSAVFGSLCLLIIGYFLTVQRSRFASRKYRVGLAASSLFLLVAALVGGSRAGLLTTFLSLLAIALMFWSVRAPSRSGKAGRGWVGRILSNKTAVLGISAILLIGLIAVFWVFRSVPALDQMREIGSFEDFRFLLWEPLGKMVTDFWLLGSGFGSFEMVYHIYEPTELLFSFYVNQAHNDWVQLLIEGGVPAVVLLFALIFWITKKAKRILREDAQGFSKLIFWAAILIVICFASLVDYPLRTPIFQLIAVWLLAAFSREKMVAVIKG